MLKQLVKVKLKVIGVIAVSLILVQVISAYFFGIIAEKQINLQFKQLTTLPLIKVVNFNYNRGWFRATNHVTLEVNNQMLSNVLAVLPATSKSSAPKLNTSNYQINYTMHITHGLFAGWLNGNLLPTLAYTKTDLQLPDSLTKVLQTFFAKQAPLQITNIIYLNKSGKFGINSPSFNYEEALSGVKVIWGGLAGTIAYDPSFSQFTTQLQLPQLQISAPTRGEIYFKQLGYRANSTHSPNDLRVGSTELALESIQVNWQESGAPVFKFGEAIHTVTGINSVDFLNSIDVINPYRFTLTGVKYKSVSADLNNLFNSDVNASFAQIQSNGKNYGPFDFQLSLNHIAAPQFSHLIDMIESISVAKSNSPADKKIKLMAVLKQDLTPIFANAPLVTLHQLSLVTPSGLIEIKGDASMHNFQAIDMNDQESFMRKISLNLDFSVPKPILAYFFVLQMKYFLTAGNAQMDQQSSEALAKVVNILLDNQLHVWLKKGYLSESHNQLSSHIQMENGVTTLNGIVTK